MSVAQSLWPIYIPSRGRAESAKLPVLLAAEGITATLVVEPWEADAYRAAHPIHEVWVLPDSHRGLVYSRNHILDLGCERNQRWIWMIDDDIQHFYRAEDGRCAKVAALSALLGGQDLADENVGQVAIEYQQRAWSAKAEVKEDHYCNGVVAFNLANPTRYRFTHLMEDRDFTLQTLLHAKMRTRRALRWAFASPGLGSNKGGLHEAYAAGGRTSGAHALAAAWPNHVQVTTKKTGVVDALIDWPGNLRRHRRPATEPDLKSGSPDSEPDLKSGSPAPADTSANVVVHDAAARFADWSTPPSEVDAERARGWTNMDAEADCSVRFIKYGQKYDSLGYGEKAVFQTGVGRSEGYLGRAARCFRWLRDEHAGRWPDDIYTQTDLVEAERTFRQKQLAVPASHPLAVEGERADEEAARREQEAASRTAAAMAAATEGADEDDAAQHADDDSGSRADSGRATPAMPPSAVLLSWLVENRATPLPGDAEDLMFALVERWLDTNPVRALPDGLWELALDLAERFYPKGVNE